MNEYELEFTDSAVDDLMEWRYADKSACRKIDRLLEEIRTSPYFGTGKPEPLKHELSGFWSRRINSKDRIVYRVDEQAGVIEIVSVRGHY